MRLHLAQEETTCQLDVPAATAIVTGIHDSAAECSSLLELITFPRGKKTSQAGGGGGDSPISKLHQGMGGGGRTLVMGNQISGPHECQSQGVGRNHQQGGWMDVVMGGG